MQSLHMQVQGQTKQDVSGLVLSNVDGDVIVRHESEAASLTPGPARSLDVERAVPDPLLHQFAGSRHMIDIICGQILCGL
jgi:hypothetical protein